MITAELLERTLALALSLDEASVYRELPLRLSHTLAAMTSTVRAQPGLTIEAAILATRHHYRDDTTALRALPRWIRAGMVPGITILCGALFPFALVEDGPQPMEAL